MRKHIIGLLVAVAALLATRPARANVANVYVCATTLVPADTGFGASGYVTVALNTSEACTGTAYYAVLCSAGATASGVCDPSYQYSETQLVQIVTALQQQMINGRPVDVRANATCQKGSYVYCVSAVSMR